MDWKCAKNVKKNEEMNERMLDLINSMKRQIVPMKPKEDWDYTR